MRSGGWQDLRFIEHLKNSLGTIKWFMNIMSYLIVMIFMWEVWFQNPYVPDTRTWWFKIGKFSLGKVSQSAIQYYFLIYETWNNNFLIIYILKEDWLAVFCSIYEQCHLKGLFIFEPFTVCVLDFVGNLFFFFFF